MSTPSKILFVQKSPIARQEWLLLSDYLSDVVFQVGQSGQLMPAHKLVITLASEVFYAQFNGSFAESNPDNRNKPVAIEDIEPATFTEVLRYIYCEKANVTADNVIDIYYASQKYMLKGLNEVCEKFLKTIVNENNVLKVFNGNRQHKFAEVDQLCMKIIQDNPMKCFSRKDFLALNQLAVEMITSSRIMNCHEEQLLEAIEKWKKANGLEVSIKPKLEALQCSKLCFYSKFLYKENVYTELEILVDRKLYLYGVGVFVGRKLDSNYAVNNVLITVNIEPNNAAASKTVTLSKDSFIEEVMFQKVTVAKKCCIKVRLTQDKAKLSTEGTEFFCLDEFDPVDSLGAVNLTVTNLVEQPKPQQIYYGGLLYPINPPPSTNSVAYLLYNVDN